MSSRPEVNDEAYLWDMRENAILVNAIVDSATYDEFLPGSMLRLAVERAIEIIGEAAGHVTTGMRVRSPDIPWRQIVGLRNVLVHEYGQIDPVRLWYTATHDMNPLIKAIDSLVPRSQMP